MAKLANSLLTYRDYRDNLYIDEEFLALIHFGTPSVE